MSLPIPSQITSFFDDHAEHVIRNLFIVTQGVFESRSTNLNLVKDRLPNILGSGEEVKSASHYKRLIRFFQLPVEEKERLVYALLSVSFFFLHTHRRKPKYLILDGTSWELGCTPIHLITLGVVINGVSIPIAWEELTKKGTSNIEERKALFDQARRRYDLSGMIVLADREYIGEEWFKYLKDSKLDFVIRLKKDVYRQYVDEQRTPTAASLLHQKWRYSALERIAMCKRNRRIGACKQIQILGQNYTFVVFKNPKANAKEPLFYFLSTLVERKKIIKAYPIRWKIECCFKHLKSNGFNLEDLNLKTRQKIKLMMAIVCFLYTLCVSQGLLVYQRTKSSDYRINQKGLATLAVSVFRKGKSKVSMNFHDLASFL
jgi:hypothetical protein